TMERPRGRFSAPQDGHPAGYVPSPNRVRRRIISPSWPAHEHLEHLRFRWRRHSGSPSARRLAGISARTPRRASTKDGTRGSTHLTHPPSVTWPRIVTEREAISTPRNVSGLP